MLEVPEAFLDVVDEVAVSTLGRADARGGALAARVAELSHLYNRDRSALASSAREDRLAARLRFFLPRDLPKVVQPLSELRAVGALPTRDRWRVLDLGAGLGATTLGAALFAARTRAAGGIAVEAVDPWARGLSILERLAARATEAGLVPVSVRTRAADVCRGPLPDGPFDLVLLGFVLNELPPDSRLDLVLRASERLAEGGSLVVLEPALREVARDLHRLRDAIVARGGPPHVVAPCLRGGGCPMLESDRDWCHEDLRVPLPEPLAAVAREAGLRFERLTFAYLTLRRDPRSVRELAAGSGGEPYRVVGGPLKTKGKLELFGCGAPGLVRLVRLDRHRAPENAAFGDLRRGDLAVASPGEPTGGRLRVGPGVRLRRIPGAPVGDHDP